LVGEGAVTVRVATIEPIVDPTSAAVRLIVEAFEVNTVPFTRVTCQLYIVIGQFWYGGTMLMPAIDCEPLSVNGKFSKVWSLPTPNRLPEVVMTACGPVAGAGVQLYVALFNWTGVIAWCGVAPFNRTAGVPGTRSMLQSLYVTIVKVSVAKTPDEALALIVVVYASLIPESILPK
jgi:hypothetical protein